MAQRSRRILTWKRMALPLTNAVAVEKGELICIDTATGLFDKGGVSTTLLPVGYADEDLTGDGTVLLHVTLFDEKRLHVWDNDTGTPVTAADIGSDAYIVDERSVSSSSATNTRSVAGRIFGVTSEGVIIDPSGV